MRPSPSPTRSSSKASGLRERLRSQLSKAAGLRERLRRLLGFSRRGATLSVAYALGLGIPFILLGLAYRRMLGAVRWVRRHQVWVTRIGGLMLVAVGVLLLTGWWELWVAELSFYRPLAML